jgi:hypothetical protein
MKEFYITHVGDSHTFSGELLKGSIGITAKDTKGNVYPLRLIAGFDPYMSVLLVRNGLLGIYRFDRRMTAMSDRSELEGIDQEALTTIVGGLCRNVFSEESGVVFLKQLVGDFMFPQSVGPVVGSGVYAGNQLVFTLTKKEYSNTFAVALGRMTAYQLQNIKKSITGIEPAFAKLFVKLVRRAYGRQMSVNYNNCFIKR